MIKSIVEKIMVKEFSKYINGIEYNKLTIEVLGGYFSIENISLNHDFFNSLQTPFLVAFSHIGKLSIQAPLTKLSSVPVACTIEDVYVIVQLKKHANKLSDVKKEELLMKYIRDNFELLVSKVKEANKEQGMLDKLGKKIIDNLKFQVKNIHIRFEQNNQRHCYSFGASLKSLTFGTTDKNWKPVFIERQKSKSEEPIFKCMNIEHFKIYWQSLPQRSNELFLSKGNREAMIDAMRKYVSIQQDSFLTINCLVKLTINPSSNTQLPLIELQINLDPINIKFSKQKIVQILDFTTSCIKHNEIMLKTLLDKATKKVSHEQEMKMKPLCQYYTRLYLQEISKKDKEQKKIKQNFGYLFDNCAIEDLYEWSMGPIKETVQYMREKELKKEKKSWFSSNEVKLSSDEVKELQRLLDELTEDTIGGKGRPQQCILLRLKLHLKGLSFYFYDQNINNRLKTVELKIESIDCLIEKSHNKSWFLVRNKIQKIVADLQVEEMGETRRIQLMQNLKDNQQHLLEMAYIQSVKVARNTTITTQLNVTLGKTLFTYKQEYWKMFSSFFSLPEINQQVQNEAFGKLQLLKGESSDSDTQAQIVNIYNMELSLMSPCFILPLSDSTCWYLDLGTITMKSSDQKGECLYPFKLRNLNMRYIDTKTSRITTDRIINSHDFFPIIKDINLDVDMTTSVNTHKLRFDIFLDKIELSATRNQFVNLLNVKKFLVGEQREQLLNLEEQKRNREEIQNKAKVRAKIYKRRKYLHNWIEHYCCLSNNSLYFYLNQSQLIPDTILSLRGAKSIKYVLKYQEGLEYQLEIVTGSEITYLQFIDQQTLEHWDTQIANAAMELKTFDALMVEGQKGEKKKKHHKEKVEDLVDLNLQLKELSWNYIGEKGQNYMKIEFNDFTFKVNEGPQQIETIFSVQRMNIFDKVFQYQRPQYQHLLKSRQLTLSVKKVKQKITKISPVILNAQLASLDLNWKPDALLIIIQSIKQFMDIKPISKNVGKSKEEIINSFKKDKDFVSKRNRYIKNGSNYAVKDKRSEYLKINAKDDEIYAKLQADISHLKITFIHRQSHMPMFTLESEQLSTNITLGKNQKFVSGHLQTLNLYQIFGYPQKKYDLNAEYPPFSILKKQKETEHLQALEFKYSQYDPQQIANHERVDSFLELVFSPLTIYYFQEVTMRMIDYFFIQILLLLTNPQMVTVNEDILKQLLDTNRKNYDKPKYFLDDEFQNVVRRYFQPFFMDYSITLKEPEVILTPTKQYPHFFKATASAIAVGNRQAKTHRRFDSTDYAFKNMVYQEDIMVAASKLRIHNINNSFTNEITQQPIDLCMIVNRLLFQEEITGISDIAGYDRSFQITNSMTALRMPELSKIVYENMVRLPNFNLTFEDQQEELFIHNYRITKTLSPKPIQYTMKVEQLSVTAQHSLEELKDIKLKLFNLDINNFQLTYNRDNQLNSHVEIIIEEATSDLYQYPQLPKVLKPIKKPLAKITKTKNKSNCYFLIKLANTSKIDIQGCIQECQLYLNAGVLPLIADWTMVQDSVFPGSTKMYRPIYCAFRMPMIQVTIEDSDQRSSSLKSVGEMVVEVSRFAGESQNFLKEGYQNNRIQTEYIEKLREYMSIKLNLGVQFYSMFRGQSRKLLQKVGIQFSELDFFKIRNSKFKKTYHRKLTMSELRGSISIDDLLLFKCMGDTLRGGDLYKQKYKEMLQQQFCKSEFLNQSKMYQDLFKGESMLEEMSVKVQGLKFYFISKEGNEYIPIFRVGTNKLQTHQFINNNNQVISGDFNLYVNYFNDQIFRWEPLLEPILLKVNMMTDNSVQTVEMDVINDINLNVSRQNVLSLRKWIKQVRQKLSLLQEGRYFPGTAHQFISRYIIKNETGYPLQIFNEQNASMYVIMTGDQINYTSKAILDCFFQENELKQTISFCILHPKQELLPVSAISLESLKSFDISLYSTKGIKLPDNCGLYLENEVQGCKKVLTIRSKKFVTDYTQGVKYRQFYPFDCEDNIVLNDNQHKGFKANFYKITQSERFIYNGSYGHLVIRKKYLVYNYTIIPLTISDYIVVPGQFIGIKGQLTIQGVPYDDSPLQVIYNDKKKEYYIYSISYILDYTGLNFTFDTDHPINKLYSHVLRQKNREVHVYLLPQINTSFTVKRGKNSNKKELKGKLAKQGFSLVQGNEVYLYNCFSSLQTFCQQRIKDFKKVIQITYAYMVCNDTEDIITFNQIEQKPMQLEPHKTCYLYWTQQKNKQLLQISIVRNGKQWQCSSPLPITESTETFIIRSGTDQSLYNILGVQLQQTNNITFIHIIEASHKMQLLNSIPQSLMTVYQTVIFENRNVKVKQPENYLFQLGYKERKAFGYELPKNNHSVTVQIELNQQHYSWKCPSFQIPDLESNLIEKTIELKSKDFNHRIIVTLSFTQQTKTIQISLKKRELFKENIQTQIKCQLKVINLSLIGLHEHIRKELTNCCITDLNLNFYLNEKYFESSISAKTIRVENTLKVEPYFVSLLRQAEESQRPAFLFASKKSRTNPKLIYYIGCSMQRLALTVTSEELEILQKNINSIMEDLHEKSDTNCFINLQQKFTPSKIINDEKIYFSQAELHPLKLIMTYKHVNNWGGTLLKALSINDCKVKVDGKKITNFVSKDLLDFTSTVGTHFKDGFRNEIFSMIGSLALLGSPLNLASKIGCGLSNLITLPADGFEGEGVLGVGKGLALGTGSLISNTVEGAFGTVQSITGTIGNGISGLASYDKGFEKKRQELKNERVQHVGQGLLSGGKSIFNGVLSGITGIVKEPIKGAEKEGLGGFLKGGLKGITGLIIKPVSGVIDATSKTAEGIKNTTKVFSKETKQLRTRKYIPRPFYGSFRQIRNYDKDMASWNQKITSFKPKYETLSWAGLFELKAGEILVVTYEYLLILSKYEFEVKKEIPSSDLLTVGKQNDKIVMVFRDEENQRLQMVLQPKRKEQCLMQMRNIYLHYQKKYEIGMDRKTPK